MKTVDPTHEYLFWVDVRDSKTGKFIRHSEPVLARGMAGVALLLKRKLDDVRYAGKELVR